MQIRIERPSEEELKKINVYSWPIWTKEISKFDWYYDTDEFCLIIEGRVFVETPDGNRVEIKAGDFVTFPKGLSCKWEIVEPIKKYYRMGSIS